MNKKAFLLFILFLFNFSATVLADSVHIDFSADTHHLTENEKSDSPDTHCEDHDCCHQSHVHYYLMPLMVLAPSPISSNYQFPEYLHAPTSNVEDIIKPPLV